MERMRLANKCNKTIRAIFDKRHDESVLVIVITMFL
jgi:hypothetical protein